jgi:hypothetical protein
MDDAVNKFYQFGQLLELNGNFPGFQRAEVSRRERHGGSEFSFRSGMSFVSREGERKPKFEIYRDVTGSLKKEFKVFLHEYTPVEISSDDLLSEHLAVSALGEMLYTEVVFGQKYARTPERINLIKEIHADRRALMDGVEESVPDEAKQEVFQFVSGYLHDDMLIRINGMRAGHTLFRALSGLDSNTRPEIDENILSYHEAFVSHVLAQAPKYENLSQQVNGSTSKGLKSLAFFIPEWLIVNAFPMPTEKVELLLQDKGE